MLLALALAGCSKSYVARKATESCREMGFIPGTDQYAQCVIQTASDLRAYGGW